jgi:hypothetical protein
MQTDNHVWSVIRSHEPSVRAEGDSFSKGKAISVTGRGGPLGCDMSRLPHFLDNRLTDDGEVVSLMRRPLFTPRKIPDTHLC